MRKLGWVRIAAWIGLVAYLALGAWAFVAPREFFDQFVAFPPYNEHLVHDLGAFWLGTGAALAFAVLGWSGLATALGGAAVGSTLHLVAHFIDDDIGGKSSDFFTLGALAVLLVAATVALRQGRGTRRR